MALLLSASIRDRVGVGAARAGWTPGAHTPYGLFEIAPNVHPTRALGCCSMWAASYCDGGGSYRFRHIADPQIFRKPTLNVEVAGAARLYRAASVLTTGWGRSLGCQLHWCRAENSGSGVLALTLLFMAFQRQE
jgi:hypothetical protein